ncbi:hypothetical protein BH20ACT18_BH20ACT18_10880 [soil metagenome]
MRFIAPVTISELRAGTEINGYRLEEIVGRGGMGVVYRAEQVRLGRPVALKIISPQLAGDAEFRHRFERESRLAAALDHPNVVPVHEAGELDGLLYIAMRYVAGTDLGGLIARHGALEPTRAARIVAQVGAALDAAHARGLVHRDVKPANILMTGTGEDEHAYLSDFGLTKSMESASGITATDQWVGTLDYVAPEQIQGKDVDGRADVYALGGVLYHALAGQAPFTGTQVAKMWAHLNNPPPTLGDKAPHVAAAFDPVLQRSLAKDAAHRYPSAGDLGRAAVAAANGGLVTEPERSVARGEAATGLAGMRIEDPNHTASVPWQPPATTPPGPNRETRLDPVVARAPLVPRPPAAEATTAVLDRRSSSKLPLILAMVALLAVGGLGAALASGAISNGGSGSGGDTADNEPQSKTGEGPPRDPALDRNPKSPPRGGETSPGPGGTAAPAFEPFAGDSYEMEVPAGWTAEQTDTDENGDGTRLRSKWISPGRGVFLIVDHTPYEPASPKGFLDRSSDTSGPRSVSLPTGTSAQAFRGRNEDCPGGCVDYIVDTSGGGFGIYAGAQTDADLELAEQVARHAAETLQPD